MMMMMMMALPRLLLLWASCCGCALAAPARVTEADRGESRTLALELNQRARQLYHQVETPKVAVGVTDPPLMIRPEDNCSPDSLQQNPEPCLSRILLALKNYTRIFGDGGLFQGQNTNCNRWRVNATAVAEVTKRLMITLKDAVEPQAPLQIDSWMIEGYLCRDSVERLYSFSIVAARVFNHLHSLQSPP